MNIYQTCYDLINQYIFNMTLQSGTHQDLIAVMLSTIATVFLFALPFLVVWKVIKLIMG